MIFRFLRFLCRRLYGVELMPALPEGAQYCFVVWIQAGDNRTTTLKIDHHCKTHAGLISVGRATELELMELLYHHAAKEQNQ